MNMLDDKLKYVLIKDLNAVLESIVEKAKQTDETLNKYNVDGLIFTTTKANSNVYYIGVPEELRVIYDFTPKSEIVEENKNEVITDVYTESIDKEVETVETEEVN